jgi:Domain of unknown function (DUF4918)
MLSQNIIDYYLDLDFKGDLPAGVSMMNPIKENKHIKDITIKFYKKYYNDNRKRHLILGINPGRLGAGATGIPFTDTKRLIEKCGIPIDEMHTHEPSSVFVYDVIDAYGGPKKFYSKFYINSVCPLGFTIAQEGKKDVNYNYYDNKALQDAVYNFIKWNIETQIKLGCYTDKCYCLGTGINYKFLKALNDIENYFVEIIPLDHPRYVMQYKLLQKQKYIDKYLALLKNKS